MDFYDTDQRKRLGIDKDESLQPELIGRKLSRMHCRIVLILIILN